MPSVQKTKTTVAKKNHKFVIDCTAPAGKIVDVAAFEKYLVDRIKVENKVGNLGSNVVVSKDKSKIVINTTIPFSKRYLKYLTKKFLKFKQIRDFLRVVATTKNTYELRYFNIDSTQADE